MSDLYDCEASMRRVHRAELDVKTQQICIAKLVDPQARDSAQASLNKLEDMLEIARKTHSLIMDVILQRDETRVMARGSASVFNASEFAP